MFYVYCDKCGRVALGNPNWEKEGKERCDVCGGNRMKHVPEEYIGSDEILTDKQTEERINQPNGLIDQLVKTSPNFDPYFFEHRNEIIQKNHEQWNRITTYSKAMEENQANIPKCPTCGSTNIRKMGGVERGASIAAFGIFSKKINKTFKCGNCGSTW